MIQGENDPHAPKEEAEQVVNTLTHNGKIMDARFYLNEVHVLNKRDNQIESLQRIVAWLDRHLKGNTHVKQP